jgi:hypothetical protein
MSNEREGMPAALLDGGYDVGIQVEMISVTRSGEVTRFAATRFRMNERACR